MAQRPTAQQVRRRRRALLGGVAGLALAAGAATGAGAGDGDEDVTATVRPDLATVAMAGGSTAEDAGSRRADAAAGDSRRALDRAVGSRIVTRMKGTTPSRDLRRRIRRGQVGGVILFADNIRSLPQVRTAVKRLQAAAKDGGHAPLLVMVDQEGGLVKRFRSLPPSRSALAMGDHRRPATTARREGRDTAKALRDIGVRVNLAPVVDVPRSRRSFLGTRAFGTTTSRVRSAGCAFADGVVDGGGIPALKHFPGLGRAGANTDDVGVRIAASRRTIEAGWAPYRRCGRDADRLVMIASAVYPALGGDDPAVLERRTYDLLREKVDSEAVTISDDLETPALDGERDVEVRAARAGLDLLLFAKTESAAARAYRRLRAAVREGRLTRSDVLDAAERIDALRRGSGDADG